MALKQAVFSDMEGALFKDLGITAVRNYNIRLRRDIKSGELTKLNLPKSDVVYYELTDGWFCIRPSGTESKIKIYFEVWDNSSKSAKKRLDRIKRSVMKKITNIYKFE